MTSYKKLTEQYLKKLEQLSKNTKNLYIQKENIRLIKKYIDEFTISCENNNIINTMYKTQLKIININLFNMANNLMFTKLINKSDNKIKDSSLIVLLNLNISD